MASNSPIIGSDSFQNIAWNTLQVGPLIGNGSYGDVYRGTWNGKTVAIKKLVLKKLDELKQDFENETKIMAECQSERILRLFAACNEVGNYAMVMEFMEKGSLYQQLHDEKVDLPWSLRWRLGLEIGEGLTYLHGKKILHRDLKSHNILLDALLHPKITDFGLAKIKVQTSSSNSGTRPKAAGTVRWHPSELLKRGAVNTPATDVYSYGMVLWEIASRKLPFSDAVNETVVMGWIQQGEQETVPSDCPEPYGALIKRCWSVKAEERPSAFKAVQALVKAMPKEKQKAWHADVDVKSVSLASDKNYVLVPASQKDFERVLGFYSHHPVPGYEIASVQVIHNPSLNRSFELQLSRLQQRHDNPAFAPKWSWDSDPDQRTKIIETFEALAQPHQDSDYQNVRLLPLWHGTDSARLDSILRIGYNTTSAANYFGKANLFGKGFYSSHEAEHALKGISSGALLLNWVAAFSPYPVIDEDKKKFEGAAVFQNYDAHFITVIDNQQTQIVVFESAACLPRYLVKLQPVMMNQQAQKVPEVGPKVKTAGVAPSIAAQQSVPISHQKMFEALDKKEYQILAQLLYSEDPLLKQHEELADTFNKSEWGQLQLAVILGRLDRVQDLCKQSPHAISTQDVDGNSLLIIGAGWGGHLAVLQWLVAQDRSLLQKGGNDGWTPLQSAAFGGNLAVVQWLVAQDRSLLQKGDNGGRTPLHYAAFGGNLAVVQWLVAQDRSLLQKGDNAGRTPLHWAAFGGNLAVVQWLVAQDRSLLEKRNIDGWTPLHMAAMNGHHAVAQWFVAQDLSLLQKVDNTGMTPLNIAALYGHLAVVQWLVAKDRSLLQKRNNSGDTPLHQAASSGKLQVAQCLVTQDKSLLKEKNTYGETAEACAQKNGKLEVAEWLKKANQ